MDISTVCIGFAAFDAVMVYMANEVLEEKPELRLKESSVMEAAILSGLTTAFIGWLVQPDKVEQAEQQLMEPIQAIIPASAQPLDKDPKVVILSQERYDEMLKNASQKMKIKGE